MPETAGTSQCAYHRLENGIHEFIPHNSSRTAFDDMLEYFECVYIAEAQQPIILVLQDLRQSGLPTLRYSFQRAQESLARAKKEGRTIPASRNACLYSLGMLITLLQSFGNLLNARLVSRFFAQMSAIKPLGGCWKAKRLKASDAVRPGDALTAQRGRGSVREKRK